MSKYLEEANMPDYMTKRKTTQIQKGSVCPPPPVNIDR